PRADQLVVGRALSKKPEERYPSCVDFVRALQHLNAPPLHEAAASSAALTPSDPDLSTTQNLRVAQCPSTEDGPPPVDPPPTEKPTDLPITYEPPPPPPERPETTGDGVLVPTLVTGLGGLGRGVLQQLRKALRKRDPNEAWPHIRLLHVDTDP